MNKNIIKMLLGGLFIWIIRLLSALPFLDDEQRLSVIITSDGRLPENVEIFFSVLILALVSATLLCCVWLFREQRDNTMSYGLLVGTVMLAVVCGLDLIFAVGLGTRTASDWFVNQFLDLSPILLIPVSVGRIIDTQKQ